MKELYRFYIGNTEWLYTSHSEEIVYGGKAYAPIPIERSDFTHEAKKNELTIVMPYDYEPASLFRGFNPPGTLWLEVLSDAGLYLFVGKVVGCKIKVEKAKAYLKVVSLQTILNSQVPSRTYSFSCSWNLFDENCGVNRGDYTVYLPVNEVSISGNKLTHTSLAGYGDGYFTGGYVESGYESSYVVDHTGDTLTLLYPLQTWTQQTNLRLYPGCDKTLSTCRNKFNNEANYGGFPFIPRQNLSTEGW